MKKIISFILFFLSYIIPQAQWFTEPIIELDTAKLQVLYKLTFIDDTNHLNYTKTEEQILVLGVSASSYESYNHYKYQKTGRKKAQEGNLMEWLQTGISATEYMCSFYYQIYKFYRNNSIIYTERIFGLDYFKYEENNDIFTWEMGQDTDTILGFICQNAFCNYGGRRWEAWFTSDINFSDGPYKFCGLPGLILKICDTKEHYKFEVLSIDIPYKNTLVEYHDRDFISTTKKDFFKVYDDNNKNMTNIVLENSGDASVAQRASQYVASKNNPLELDRK